MNIPHLPITFRRPPLEAPTGGRSLAETLPADQVHPQVKTLVARFQTRLADLQELPLAKGRVALVVAARNEEKYIASNLDGLIARTPKNGELAVVLNGCTDNTEGAVRTWAANNPKVQLMKPGALKAGTKVAEGKIPVTLIVKESGGKLGALVEMESEFRRRGQMPEFVMQVDADTQLRQETLPRLLEAMKAHPYAAVSARTHYVLPHGETRPLVLGNEVTNLLHGTPGTEMLTGQGTLSRTPFFSAGHAALRETLPQVASEDALYSALLRFTGNDTLVHRDALLDTEGVSDPKVMAERAGRHVKGTVQLNEMFGPHLTQLGMKYYQLKPTVTLAQGVKFFNQYVTHAESGQRMAHLRRIIGSVQDGVVYSKAVKAAESEPDSKEAYDWVPQR